MNLTSMLKKAVWSGVSKNNSKNRNKTFFITKMQVFKKNGSKKSVAMLTSDDVEVHVTMTLKCSQINFAKFGGLT